MALVCINRVFCMLAMAILGQTFPIFCSSHTGCNSADQVPIKERIEAVCHMEP